MLKIIRPLFFRIKSITTRFHGLIRITLNTIVCDSEWSLHMIISVIGNGIQPMTYFYTYVGCTRTGENTNVCAILGFELVLFLTGGSGTENPRLNSIKKVIYFSYKNTRNILTCEGSPYLAWTGVDHHDTHFTHITPNRIFMNRIVLTIHDGYRFFFF
jgi:hypothetical protein